MSVKEPMTFRKTVNGNRFRLIRGSGLPCRAALLLIMVCSWSGSLASGQGRSGDAGAQGGFGQAESAPQDSGLSAAEPRRGSPRMQVPRISDERRAELLEFARQHQPMVARLLSRLERAPGNGFDVAIQSLDRDVRRIQMLEQRDPEMYGLALERWKSRSAINVMVARLSAGGDSRNEGADEEVRGRLAELVRKDEELKLKQMRLEQARVRARLERLEESIRRAEQAGPDHVEREVRELLDRANRNGGRGRRDRGGSPDPPAPDDPAGS